MKVIFVLVVICVWAVSSAPPKSTYALEACTAEKCKLPDCQCSQTQAPISGNIPQFVMLSFNDAAAKLIYETFWEQVLFQYKNPDDCPISGTFFVPHEYSDYEVVNKLYNHGFEIASHSISKNVLMDYWKNATKETIIAEMGGQRDILAHFANIPKDEIIGARVPLLQINKNTFEALQEAGFKYDASWPTRQSKALFPYTLDYTSIQVCEVDVSCHNTAVKGFWELPIVDWINENDIPCNSILGCYPQGTADEIFQWMKKNFEVQYKGNKAPVSIILDYAWWSIPATHQEAFKKFMEYLRDLKDVYMVSSKQVMDWAKNPTEKFSSCQTAKKAECAARPCKLQLDEFERYMVSCVACPKNYPWINNPLGN